MNVMTSKITGGPVEKIFEATVLGKHFVSYYKCKQTGFIQTEDPYWLPEAYLNPISPSDVGIISRNLTISQELSVMLNKEFKKGSQFLDYGGGYGILVRLMRDKGFNFYLQDKYCVNLFAKYFEEESVSNDFFDAVTAFEVFEHVEFPLNEVEEMFKKSDSIIFTTNLIPQIKINNENDWWYFNPIAGQHISFYTNKSFEYIASKFNCQYFTNNDNFHVLTKNKFKKNPFSQKKQIQYRIRKKLSVMISDLIFSDGSSASRKSLLPEDFDFAIKQLTNNGN